MWLRTGGATCRECRPVGFGHGPRDAPPCITPVKKRETSPLESSCKEMGNITLREQLKLAERIARAATRTTFCCSRRAHGELMCSRGLAGGESSEGRALTRGGAIRLGCTAKCVWRQQQELVVRDGGHGSSVERRAVERRAASLCGKSLRQTLAGGQVHAGSRRMPWLLASAADLGE